MDKIVVIGGNRLKGTIRISGAKNAVLPIMAATLLADGTYHISNVPVLKDVKTMLNLLNSIGSIAELSNHILRIKTGSSNKLEAPYHLVKTMRASIYVLGPLVSRFGYGKVSLPGGCAWGPRPVNLHLEGLIKLGARVEINQGYIIAKAKRLKGTKIHFDRPSVGATGNILMAAVLAKGSTLIKNAAKEPEIISLAQFLQKMGAKIRGIGTEEIEVEGVDDLKVANESIISDRIESGTFLIAGYITGGNICIEKTEPDFLKEIINVLEKSGAEIEQGSDWIRIRSNDQIRPVDISTAVYPGFPTDMQAQWMALMSIANGTSKIKETIFGDRFTHISELQRLGADITLKQNIARVNGVKHLSGAPVMSTDLRASASLILAGLVADGETHISRVYHIDRGYEKIEDKLKKLGADIYRDQERTAI